MSRAVFLNAGTHLISLEQSKLQISNFACILSVRDATPNKILKNGQKGRGLGHVTYF